MGVRETLLKTEVSTYYPSTARWAGAVEYTDCISAECPGYENKQSDGEAPVMLELLGMRSSSSVLLLPGPLWP